MPHVETDEGLRASTNLRDVEVEATFTEDETGERMSVHDAATSVRLEVREVYKAPENQTCVNRHVYGVGEKIEFLSYPKSTEMGLVAESFNLREERTTFYNMFKKKFALEKNQKLSDCTERLIATWIEQIESENGLCRRCLHGVWQRNLPHVESGEVKREDMLKFVRNVSAFALERMCDYVPKWINEIQ